MGAETGSLIAVLELDASKFNKSMDEAGKAAVESSDKRVKSAKVAEAAEDKAAASAERNAKRDVTAKKLQEKAAEELAKYEGKAVEEKTLRIIAAQNREKEASKALATARRIEKDGFGADGQAARAVAVAYQELTASKLALAEATKVEAAAAVEAGAAHSVSDRMAASAVVRGLETGNVGIRAVENFITTIPGASGVLQGAFSVIGPLAFAAAVGEGVMKVQEFISKVTKMPQEIENAFRALHLSAATANDELRLTNDRLQNEIDKLSGKPQNNLIVSIDETRIAGDKLASSLMRDNDQVSKLLEQNKIGIGGQLLGKGSTVEVAGSVMSYRQDLANLGGDLQQATHDGDAGQMQKLMRDIKAKQKSYLDWLNTEIKTRTGTVQGPVGVGPMPYASVHGEQSGVLNILKGERSLMYDRQDQDVEEGRNPGLVARKADLEAGRAASTQANKAEEQRLKAEEANLVEVQRQTHRYSLLEQMNYWTERINGYRVGGEAYFKVIEKQGQLEKEMTTARDAWMKDWKKQASEDQVEMPRMLARNAEDMRKGAVKDNSERDQDFVSSNQMALDLARNTAREREALLNTQAGRTMTEYAAAIDRANIHAEEFKATMVALQGILDTRQAAADRDPSKANSAELEKAKRDLEDQKSKRGIQMGADQGAIYGLPSSALVGGSDALREFIRATTDAAAEMKHFTESGLRSFNDAVLKVLTGQSGRGGAGRVFQDFGSNLFKQGAGSLLQNGEGHLMQAFGMGDGGAAKFLQKHKGSGWGKVLSTILGVGESLLPGQLTGAGGLAKIQAMAAASSVAGQGIDSGLSSLISMDALPHFAAGGAIDAHTAAIIGENGPEMFIPKSAGTIVPNHALGGGKGGSSGAFYDFTGANFGGADAGQIEARFSRALKEIHGSAVKASVKAMVEFNGRRPR